MSDTNNDAPTVEVAEQPETGTESRPEMTLEERVEFLTATNRKLEDQVKGKNADPNKSVPYLQKQRDTLQKELDAIKASQMSEQEKILARAETAEARLKQIEAAEEQKALVAEVAEEKKVPAAVLRGATREELESHADAYLASLPVIPNVPSADGLGNVGNTVNGSDSDLDAAIAAAEKARNFPLAITLKQQKAAKKG